MMTNTDELRNRRMWNDSIFDNLSSRVESDSFQIVRLAMYTIVKRTQNDESHAKQLRDNEVRLE